MGGGRLRPWRSPPSGPEVSWGDPRTIETKTPTQNQVRGVPQAWPQSRMGRVTPESLQERGDRLGALSAGVLNLGIQSWLRSQGSPPCSGIRGRFLYLDRGDLAPEARSWVPHTQRGASDLSPALRPHPSHTTHSWAPLTSVPLPAPSGSRGTLAAPQLRRPLSTWSPVHRCCCQSSPGPAPSAPGAPSGPGHPTSSHRTYPSPWAPCAVTRQHGEPTTVPAHPAPVRSYLHPPALRA